jgi:hypothetical protein
MFARRKVKRRPDPGRPFAAYEFLSKDEEANGSCLVSYDLLSWLVNLLRAHYLLLIRVPLKERFWADTANIAVLCD